MEVSFSDKSCAEHYCSNSYSFGDVHIGDKKEFSIPIENIGNIPLLIKDVTTQNNSFSIITPIVEQIKSNSIDFFKFQFSPDMINKDSALVDIYYTDPLLQNIKPDTTIKNSKLILYGVGKKSILQILDFENLTEIDTLNFNECYIDSMESKKVVLKNIGNLDLILVLPPIQISDFKLVFPEGQNSPLLILKNDTIHVNIEFHPSKAGVISDTTIFPYYDIFNSKIYHNIAILNLNGKGIARGPMTYDVSNSIPILYQDCSVQAKISSLHSELVEDSIRLWIRKGGEINFNCLNFIEKIDPDIYLFKIPGEWITLRGIEYFIDAYDQYGNYSCYPINTSEFSYISPPVRIPEPGVLAEDHNGNAISLHSGDTQSDYRLISIPANIDQDKRSVLDILKFSLGFNKYDEFYWRCADYHYFPEEDTSNFIYLNDSRFSDFSPGKSFFFILNKGLINKAIFCPSGHTIRSDEIYKMGLNKGWNLIANPFNFPIPLKNLLLSESGIVDSLYSYINGWSWENNFIYPWTGYALYTEKAESLFINPDSRQTFRPISTKKENNSEYDWFISIETSCQAARNNNNFIAVSPYASIGYDNFDKPEPPPIGEYVMLTFLHPEWGKACDFFTVDVQTPNLEGNFWDFSVYTNILNSEVKLNFKNLDSVPDNFQIVLISENLKIVQDLRHKKEFLYNSTTAQQEYRFRLLVGSKEFVESHNFNIDFLPEKFHVSINFPNPFNNATHIRYDLPDQDEISIQIYNMLGELIKTIKKNEIHSSGRYFVIWDGTNEKRIPVGSGIYFCKFISQHCCKTIKMLLIR